MNKNKYERIENRRKCKHHTKEKYYEEDLYLVD